MRLKTLAFIGATVAGLWAAFPSQAQDAPQPSAPATEQPSAPPAEAPPAGAAEQPAPPAAGAAESGAAQNAQPPQSPPQQADAAKDAKPAPRQPTLRVTANLSTQTVTVTENGVTKHSWPMSSGTARYATQPGRFTAQWTARMHYSEQWDNAPMPYAVFFNRGTAFHGTSATRSLGRPASHGCIRLATGNARKLYDLVHKHGLGMTRVVVHGRPNYGGEAVARRDEPRRGKRRRDFYDEYASNDDFAPRPRRRRGGRPIVEPFGGMWD